MFITSQSRTLIFFLAGGSIELYLGMACTSMPTQWPIFQMGHAQQFLAPKFRLYVVHSYIGYVSVLEIFPRSKLNFLKFFEFPGTKILSQAVNILAVNWLMETDEIFSDKNVKSNFWYKIYFVRWGSRRIRPAWCPPTVSQTLLPDAKQLGTWWAEVVAQLVEWSLPIHSSNPVFGKIYHQDLFIVNCIKKTKIRKRGREVPIFKLGTLWPSNYLIKLQLYT